MLAVDQPVDPAEVIAAGHALAGVGRQEHLVDLLDPAGGQGVGGEEIRERRAPSGLLHAQEGGEQRDDLAGSPAGPAGVEDAQAVGLVFVVAAELEGQDLQADHGEGRDLGDVLAQGAGHEQAAQHQELAAHGPGGVAGVDVAQLVADDRGQGGLVVHQGQHAAGDVDVSAGRGEGVLDGRVQDGEVIGQVGTVGEGHHLAADALDVGVEGFVVVDAVLLPDADVRLLAHLDLGRLGDQHQLRAGR